ncbi:hypothetical protein MetMK1DRAFT_00020560 [Metallosphaera yellowstonensis MK1]|uniref:Uncharacterized protein n=1 Tax=Metallosphaera yellowstonensis MK1 TaxID=671065 RepID=H2C679_9CREN|nr:hypothetical protein MetMK1DRAFT_00020560 [Metallosphaera yellowstonensis MK1]
MSDFPWRRQVLSQMFYTFMWTQYDYIMGLSHQPMLLTWQGLFCKRVSFTSHGGDLKPSLNPN